MNPITLLDYPIDITKILEIAAEAKSKSISYKDPRYPKLNIDNWKISKFNNGYLQQIIDDFEVKGSPRFYWLKENTYLPIHVDNGTTCSINFILTEDAAPVRFNDVDYFYKQALLNTMVPHSVLNKGSERILLKISIANETYEELANRIKFKKNTNE
jgi:hypothetical protein